MTGQETDPASPENWTPPRELTRALPREISMTGSGIVVAILAAMVLLGSVPLLVLLRSANARDKAQAEALRTEGRETAGQIVRLWHTTGKSHTPTVTYAFTANGTRLHADATVPGEFWSGLRTGGVLPVRYLPSDPNINHPAAWEISTVPDWMPFLLPALLGGIGILFLTLLRRQAQVAANGIPAAGVVTKCFRVKSGWVVRYRFHTKDGAIARGSSQAAGRLEESATICVLYLTKNPKRNQMYPTGLYRVRQ
jgi:hypothetical protein